jgi:hypothetical protein
MASRCTRPHAGALHLAGREALLRYVLRPPLSQQRLPRGAGDLVRMTLKRAYADGTVAVEMDRTPLATLATTSNAPSDLNGLLWPIGTQLLRHSALAALQPASASA